MSRAILTLPMMPVNGDNYGKYVTPIVCETIKNILDAKYYHCINLLDSFNDRQSSLQKYILSLNEKGIKYDELWFDSYNIDKLLQNIDLLIKKGYITEIYSNVFRCDCGVVEIEKNKIQSCNHQNLKFSYKNNNMICKICGGVCKEYMEKILIFNAKNIKKDQIICLPMYLNKDSKTYNNIVLNSYTTISRKRKTGVELVYNGTKYNIDIDFLWATYLANFSEEEKIVVSGNRMLYQLFLVGVLEKCLNPKSNTILLGTPYLTNIKEIINDKFFKNDEKFQKLAIIFNLKWQKKEKNYDETILRYLFNMCSEKREQLYNILNKRYTSKDEFLKQVNDIIMYETNMQQCIKKLKIERGIKNV